MEYRRNSPGLLNYVEEQCETTWARGGGSAASGCGGVRGRCSGRVVRGRRRRGRWPHRSQVAGTPRYALPAWSLCARGRWCRGQAAGSRGEGRWGGERAMCRRRDLRAGGRLLTGRSSTVRGRTTKHGGRTKKRHP